jgi:hypothetical protein
MSEIPKTWRQTVVQALEKLQAGDDRGFEDQLWLGLGDAWWPLRKALIRKGLIELSPDAVYPKITTRGLALLQKSPHSESV